MSAHKSVAVLGVIGRADDMHAILDTETEATLEWLDRWFQARGGRRGRAQVRTPTSGLTYATTRHGTSRDGDPGPHDHVLVANVVEMLDSKGGFKGLDSASLRDTTEAATMVGRLASAARAVELGYAIEPDDGPSGHLRHWRIVGIPREVCDLFSKRADEISEYLAESGYTGPRARAVAARQTRTVKRHTGVDELLPTWIAELEALGWTVERLSAQLDAARLVHSGLAEPLSAAEIDALAASVLDVDGSLLRDRKVFTRTRLIAEVAPRLYGADPPSSTGFSTGCSRRTEWCLWWGSLVRMSRPTPPPKCSPPNKPSPARKKNSPNGRGGLCRMMSSRPRSPPRRRRSIIP